MSWSIYIPSAVCFIDVCFIFGLAFDVINNVVNRTFYLPCGMVKYTGHRRLMTEIVLLYFSTFSEGLLRIGYLPFKNESKFEKSKNSIAYTAIMHFFYNFFFGNIDYFLFLNVWKHYLLHIIHIFMGSGRVVKTLKRASTCNK